VSAEPAGGIDPHSDVTASVAARVQSVLSAAEREATQLQQEVEASSQRRATEVLLEAEREAARLLNDAGEAVAAYLDDARDRIDAYVADRVQRIHGLTERLLAAADDIAVRLDEAGETRRAVAALVDALGEAARDATRQGAERLPPPPPTPPAPRADPAPAPPGADG
jgi:hypothetical protein